MEWFDFEIDLSDWSLQAIVKGCTNTSDHIITMQKTTEEDYTRHVNESVEHLNIVNSGMDQSVHNRVEVNPTRAKKEKGASVSLANSKEIFKTRRRKNKYEMNVVQQVAEDRVLSDKWNWRKYGQKTIKGSPYPRNYYKCSSSSSGGCKARKQVEHSSTNPENLLIAYIHEHNHPYPTRRHSQAGRAKERFQPLPKLATTSSSFESSSFGDNNKKKNNTNFQCNNSYKDINVTERLEDGGSVTSTVWDDEFFDGLEYLEGLSQEYVLNPSHVPQESTMFCLTDWEQGRNY